MSGNRSVKERIQTPNYEHVIMLSVTMPSAIVPIIVMPNVIMLSVIMPSVIMLRVIMLSVIMLRAIMLEIENRQSYEQKTLQLNTQTLKV